MATFNRSEIMKSAWNFVRTVGKSISEGLKAAWAKAKNITRKYIVKASFEVNGQKKAFKSLSMPKGDIGNAKSLLISKVLDFAEKFLGLEEPEDYPETKEEQIKWNAYELALEEVSSTITFTITEEN